jgi:signal transduction histidine kinase/putative methionine-R-sulfoxide reductase with GAF domain
MSSSSEGIAVGGGHIGQSSLGLGDMSEVQAALRRVAAIAAAAEPPEAVFAAVAAEGSALLDGGLLSLARYSRDGSEIVVLAQTGGHVAVGSWFSSDNGAGINARMWKSGRPERIDDFAALPGMQRIVDLGVRACVAVPVIVDGTLWGSLAAASRTGPLPATTEARLTMLAEVVAVAVVSAAARASVRVLADEQAALLRVAALVAHTAPESAVFDAVTVEAASIVDDEPTTLVRYEGKRTFTVLATRGGPVGPGVRVTVPVGDAGVLDEMLRTHQPARRDRYDVIADRSFSNRDFAVGSSVSVPIFVQGRLWGALGVLNEGRRLPAETEGRLAKFAELVGSALANVAARAELKRFGEEQAALRRVAELAASGEPYASVLRSIVVEASLLFDEAVVGLGQFGPSGTWERVDVSTELVGDLRAQGVSPEEDVVAQNVLATSRPARIEDDDPSAGGRVVDDKMLRGCGVPVVVEGRTWGAMIATSRQRPLPWGTEDRLAHFAHVAATAVTGAQSRDALSRLARDQAALRRVAELIARGASLDEVFDAVATEASNILGGTAVGLFRYDPDGLATVVAQRHSPVPVGMRIPSHSVGVRASRQTVRFATLAGTPYAQLGLNFAVESLVAVPITVEGQIWGGLALTTPRVPPSADAEDRLREFAELAAAAVANGENRAKLRASRARLVVTADETRQRLQRDVHDGAQQRLVQTVLSLKLGLDMAARGEDPVELMREALQSAERATVELRDLVHGILPASLSRGGLRTGVRSLIAGLPGAVDLDVSALPDQRQPAELEVTAYFIVAEALTNVVKHAGATRARVTLAADADELTIEVVDDGRGGADPHGNGLTGLADRVDALNGSLVLTSPLGGGTRVHVSLPRDARQG